MRIRVAEIPEEGLRIEGPESFDHPFQDPTWVLADASLTVEKDGDAVFVHGSLAATVPQLCGRCLAGLRSTSSSSRSMIRTVRLSPDSSASGFST